MSSAQNAQDFHQTNIVPSLIPERQESMDILISRNTSAK